MNQYNPDEFRLTKIELIQKLELLLERWKRNPRVSKNVIRAMQIQLAFFKSRFVKESDLPYAWVCFCELFDELRSLNDRIGQTELSKLNAMHEAAFNEKIGTYPEERQPQTEKHRSKIVVDFTKSVKFGSMKDNG